MHFADLTSGRQVSDLDVLLQPTHWEGVNNDDILPGGLGLPEESLHLKSYNEIGGQEASYVL